MRKALPPEQAKVDERAKQRNKDCPLARKAVSDALIIDTRHLLCLDPCNGTIARGELGNNTSTELMASQVLLRLLAFLQGNELTIWAKRIE